jgi:molybdate transport system permease protein
MAGPHPEDARRDRPATADWPFFLSLSILGGAYVLLIAAMLIAEALYTSPGHLLEALASPAIRYAIWLSLISSSISALLSVWAAVPLGYLLARFRFPGRRLIDVLLDVPIVLPPLVVGLCLLILFQTPPGRLVEQFIPVTYAIPSVILAQFSVACAFAVRVTRATFEQIPRRREEVAMTLGCSRSQAFWRVTLPEARRGVMAAFILAWARSLGEFGPILVFSGATRFRTEVLSTTVFLELSVGDLQGALAVSLLMVAAAMIVLAIVRLYGVEKGPA